MPGNEGSYPGNYIPVGRTKPVVLPNRRYRLEVKVPEGAGLVRPGALVRAETTVPDTFSVRLAPPDTVRYDPTRPVARHRRHAERSGRTGSPCSSSTSARTDPGALPAHPDRGLVRRGRCADPRAGLRLDLVAPPQRGQLRAARRRGPPPSRPLVLGRLLRPQRLHGERARRRALRLPPHEGRAVQPDHALARRDPARRLERRERHRRVRQPRPRRLSLRVCRAVNGASSML